MCNREILHETRKRDQKNKAISRLDGQPLQCFPIEQTLDRDLRGYSPVLLHGQRYQWEQRDRWQLQSDS